MKCLARLLAGMLVAIGCELVANAAPVPADHAERMARGTELFQKEIRTVLKENCLKCHGGEKVKSDFDLATREDLLKGGSNGVAIVPFKSADSPMLKMIQHEEEPYMPEKKPKLSDEVIAKIARWIDDGAPYDAPLIDGKKPARDRSVVTADDRKWWSFQPLAKATPPVVRDGKPGGNPIDAFLLAKGAEKSLTFAPPAEPRVLVRRMYLDVIGLPPTPDQVHAFLADYAQDASRATARLADRLLASPHYGERWARHWLDVARFAESSGFEHDYDRPYAFHYRDFVIKALNADMPFEKFIRWQIAGDEFEPENPLALMATGFLGAGVFPTQITANEVERVRYDALDDMLATTGSAMLGLTVGCARCHDHKYDPIPTADYYRMLSTFTTTVRSNVDLNLDPERTKAEKQKFDDEHAQLTAQLRNYETNELRPKFEAWFADGPKELPLDVWSLAEVTSLKSRAGATFKKMGDGSWLAEGKNGDADVYVATLATTRRQLTGLKIEALADASLKAKGPGRAANGNFALSRIAVTAAPIAGGAARAVKLVAAEATHEQNKTGLSVASALDDNPKTGWAVDAGGIGKDQAAAFLFAEPLDLPGGAKLTVTLEFSVNTGHNIGRPRFSVFSDGEPRVKGQVLPATVAALVPRLQDPAQRAKLTAEERDDLFDWWKERDAGWRERNGRVAEHSKRVPVTTTPVMVCAEGYKPIVMHSQGAPFFEETHILKRGDTNQKNGLATQSFLQVLTRDADEKRWQWTPPAGAKYSGRRRVLANWLTDVDHGAGAIAARVAVNRLWQHHFGTGIVSTANDFGKTGALPSHPELLDWLAGELIRNGWQLKPLHRLMLTSAAFAQSSAADAAKLAADPDNALFLRRTPRRLEAEAVRDCMLAVSGMLDRTLFGKGTLDESSKRRSIYFTVKRSQLLNSMVVFDAPEPLVSQGGRPTTTVAPQSLLLMNSLQARMWAEAFAKRVEADAGSRNPDDLAPVVTLAYEIALGRSPRAGELQDALAFLRSGITAYSAENAATARTRAVTDLCQTVLALNEFVYAF